MVSRLSIRESEKIDMGYFMILLGNHGMNSGTRLWTPNIEKIPNDYLLLLLTINEFPKKNLVFCWD